MLCVCVSLCFVNSIIVYVYSTGLTIDLSFPPLSVTPEMKLTPSAGSDRAWVWTVQADFADQEAKMEQLAIRFKNRES